MYVSRKLFFIVIIFTISFLSMAHAHAYSAQLLLGQSHYRLETDQTGIASEFLFKPAIAASLGVTFALTKYQDLEIYYQYMKLELESDNVPLPVTKDSFNYAKWGLRYALWFNNGFAINIAAGNETIPGFSIAGLAVSFDRENPLYGTFGVLWRAKNQISTLEVGYLYKNFFYSNTDIEADGNSNSIYFVIDFGRKQNIKRGSEVFYTDHNYEGNWGIKFTYENTLINTTFENTIDERRLEVYYRVRFNQDAYYRY